MQPYQEAVETKHQSGIFNAAKNFGMAAIGTAGIGVANSLVSKILPLLSSHVPETFAKKAIQRIDPRIGKFLKDAEDEGATFDEAKEFISQKLEPAKQNNNIIQQVSPELHTFIDQEIRKGRKPIEAAALAQNDKRFGSIIQKLMKTHKTPWSSIIESIYGNGDMAQAQQGQPQGQEQQQSGQQAQGGQGLDPMVAQILQQGNAIMQKFRGQ
ncbi:MAG: hypothetical protein WC089_03810 [Candidatus Paceibacterota bacterium]